MFAKEFEDRKPCNGYNTRIADVRIRQAEILGLLGIKASCGAQLAAQAQRATNRPLEKHFLTGQYFVSAVGTPAGAAMVPSGQNR